MHITRDAEAEPELKLKRQQSVYIVPKEPPYFRYIIKADLQKSIYTILPYDILFSIFSRTIKSERQGVDPLFWKQ